MLSLNEIGLLVAVVLMLVLFGQWENVARWLGRLLRRRTATGIDPRIREWADRIRREQAGVPDDLYYHILGLTPSATEPEIRRAYRRKAKQYHPDHGGDPDIMNALTMAYNLLMGHKRRSADTR